MVLPLIGSLIGAGASLIGGMMNNNAQQSANEQNIEAQERVNAQNYEAQKEFAQQGLRWKVDDAKAAGIHPLYAVGAPAQSFSASFGAPQVGALTGAGESLASAGQDIGRAIATTQTTAERAYTAQMASLQLERGQLENDLLRTQIRRQLVESGPPFPGGPSPVGGQLMFHDGRWEKNPGTSDAQDIEDRYGDVVSALYGIGVIGSDMLHNGGGGGNPVPAGPRITLSEPREAWHKAMGNTYSHGRYGSPGSYGGGF